MAVDAGAPHQAAWSAGGRARQYAICVRSEPARVPHEAPLATQAGPIVLTRQLDADSPAGRAGLLNLIPAGAPLAWVRGRDGLVGWGEAARAEFAGPERFSRAHRWWLDFVAATQSRGLADQRGLGPVAFGSFAFDDDPGRSVVVVPRTLVRRRNGKTWITTIDGPALEPTVLPDALPPKRVSWREGEMTSARFTEAVTEVVDRIRAGEMDKVVLARDLVATVEGQLDPRYLLQQLNLDYPRTWVFSVAGLVGGTPELLVRRAAGLVTSRVLAGTVRTRGDSRDDAHAAALLASDKDLAEHEYAVGSVAAALAAHCTDLSVPENPEVLRLANVQHLATDVRGRLAEDVSVLALAASLHPTAAVCGTPTERAAALIREIEALDRGRYAGPVGWFDAHGDGEFGLALRCGQIDGSQIRLYAGCGIVAGSQPAAEVAESAAKFAAMRGALAIARR